MTSTSPAPDPDRTLRRLAWLAFAVSMVIAVAGLVFVMLARDLPRPDGDEVPTLTLVFNQIDYLTTPFLALLLTTRRPRNAVGWLIVSASIGLALFDGAEAYARWSLAEHGGTLPGTVFAAWLTNWCWALTVVIPAYLFLLYPDGRPVSQRGRWVLWAAFVHTMVMVPALMFLPGPIESFPQLDNPFGLDILAAVSPEGSSPLLGLLFGIMILLTAAGFVALVVRYRTASAIQRRQIQWLLFAGGVFLATQLVGYEVLPFVVAEALTSLSSIGFTAAIVVAVLRYRLYEIDRIISRTLGYGLVTAVLVGLYTLVAVVPAAIFDLESDLLVAGATLVAAAAFGPVRRRVQALVDRRFNRQRYDAAQVAEGFAARLRDEVDLHELAGGLRGVVATTVQPKHLSLWLRQTGTER